MRPSEVARRGADYLERHGVASARAESEALLQRILGVDRATLFTRTAGLSSAEAKAYGRALCRRCAGSPLQHLTGEQGFRGLVLEVRPGVFVPRPETEVLVDVALSSTSEAAPTVVDLCTGSGAVALAIAHERPGSHVIGTDVSSEAVTLARANASRLSLDATFLVGDLFAPIPAELAGTVDLVVANPPYLSPADRDELRPDVLADPERALFGDVDGYRRILGDSTTWLRSGGSVAVEVGPPIAAEVAEAARSAGLGGVQVGQDLNGRERVVSGRRS
jgi:release factor glutamine methyltransferase